MNIHDNFKEISVYELENAHKLIGKDWMLITAADGDRANAMTASWGALGELWGAHVAICFVRPQRYTYGLMEKQDRISLAFLDETHRDCLNLCGTLSGRDGDKLSRAGLTVSEAEGVPVINEARITVICKKLYADDLKEQCFIDKSLLKNYQNKDYHRVYVLKIEKVLVRK